MAEARFVVADVFDGIASLPDNSVDLVCCSPPFLALRSYLPSDHPEKAKELGSEPTPAAFIDTLLDVVQALDRVLAPHGSIAIELGDTFSGSGGAGGDYSDDGLRAEQPKFDGSAHRTRASGPRTEDESRLGVDARNRARRGGNASLSRLGGWPLAKSLCLIPESFRWALVYGRNPFNGRETPQWRARNVVRWCRPNPPVGALGDKFRPATSEMVIACKSDKRYFDLDAVRTEPNPAYAQRRFAPSAIGVRNPDGSATIAEQATYAETTARANEAGAPPLDFWVIPTAPYAGSHYATYPPDLCVRPIKAMCPERVCVMCGEPSRRIVDVEGLNGRDFLAIGSDNDRGLGLHGKRAPMPEITRTTTGWTDCGHNSWRSGVVLDPFAGSGTTLAVATGHGRDAIGIDIDERNADLAQQRVGMFLSVEHLAKPVVA